MEHKNKWEHPKINLNKSKEGKVLLLKIVDIC